jgi:hypothetical protein
MAEKNKQDVEKEIKDLASVAEVAFKNISVNIKDIFADALSSGEKVLSSLSKDMQRNINSLAKESNNLIINQSRINKGLITSKDISKQLLNNEDKLYLLEQQRASTIQAINDDMLSSDEDKLALTNDINKEYTQAINYNKILLEQLEKQAEQTKLIEKRTGITAKALMGLKKIPILGDILNIDKGLENMRTKALETDKSFKILGAGIKGAFEGIEKASVILALVAAAKKVFDFFIDAMFAADERVTKLAKGLMISKDGASAIYKSFTQSKFEIDSIYNTTKDINEAFTDLTELTDFATTSTKEMVEAQIILTKNIGLSKEQAFGVQEAFAASNIEADKGVDVVYDQIAAFANQNKMVSTGKAIFNDIAKTSKLIQINFKGNLGSLVKTTLEAKKLGLTLDQVTKIGSSLLNFEESISSELEAELLTGRDLNLEKARLYALNHDIAGLTQEITKQGITQKSFTDMNVIQQEAIAKSLGMSAEEMGEMLYKASVLEKVGGQDLKNKRKIADELERQGNISESINLRNEIAQLEQGILSGKSLEEAEKATSAQENFNQALEQAKEIFSDLVTGGYLDKLSKIIKNFADTFSEGAAGAITGTGKDQAKEKRGAKSAEEFTSKLKGDEKTKYEAGLQEKLESEIDLQRLINLIAQPITTLTMSGEERIKRAQNQLTKEYYEESNNIQTPQVKFNADMKAFNEQNKIGIGAPTEIPAKDFTIRTLPEDTVVGMGGTALGRTDEMVKLLTQQNQYLDKQNTLLTSIYNKEGTIELNGTKIGTGMNVGGYKTA